MNNEMIGQIEGAADSMRSIGRRDEATAVIGLLRTCARMAAELSQLRMRLAAGGEPPKTTRNPVVDDFGEILSSLGRDRK